MNICLFLIARSLSTNTDLDLESKDERFTCLDEKMKWKDTRLHKTVFQQQFGGFFIKPIWYNLNVSSNNLHAQSKTQTKLTLRNKIQNSQSSHSKETQIKSIKFKSKDQTNWSKANKLKENMEIRQKLVYPQMRKFQAIKSKSKHKFKERKKKEKYN